MPFFNQYRLVSILLLLASRNFLIRLHSLTMEAAVPVHADVGAPVSTGGAISDGPAPVTTDARYHDQTGHQANITHHPEQDSPQPKSRPISLLDLQEARREYYFQHSTTTTSDLEHYFVRTTCLAAHDARLTGDAS